MVAKYVFWKCLIGNMPFLLDSPGTYGTLNSKADRTSRLLAFVISSSLSG